MKRIFICIVIICSSIALADISFPEYRMPKLFQSLKKPVFLDNKWYENDNRWNNYERYYRGRYDQNYDDDYYVNDNDDNTDKNNDNESLDRYKKNPNDDYQDNHDDETKNSDSDNHYDDDYEDYDDYDDYHDDGDSDEDPAPGLVYNIFEGLAKVIKHPPPSSIQSCLDARTGRITLNFILNIAGEVNDSGFERIKPTIVAYTYAMRSESLECLKNNEELQNLLAAYKIKEKSLADFADRIASYGLNNDAQKIIKPAFGMLISADKEDFNSVGENAGELLKVVFESKESFKIREKDLDVHGHNRNQDDKESESEEGIHSKDDSKISESSDTKEYNQSKNDDGDDNNERDGNQEENHRSHEENESNNNKESDEDPAPGLVYNIFEGFAKAIKHPPPSSIQSCLDERTGRITLNFILNIAGEVNDSGFERIKPTIAAYTYAMRLESLECLKNNEELQNLLAAYKIKEKSLADFADKIASYGLNNDAQKIIKPAFGMLISADKEDFNSVGENAGELLKVVFDSNMSTRHFRTHNKKEF